MKSYTSKTPIRAYATEGCVSVEYVNLVIQNTRRFVLRRFTWLRCLSTVSAGPGDAIVSLQNTHVHFLNVFALQIDAPPRVAFIYGFNCTFSLTNYVLKWLWRFGRGRLPLAAGVVEIGKRNTASGDLSPELNKT